MPLVFAYNPSESRCGNIPNEPAHRVGPPFLDNHYHGYQYPTDILPLFFYASISLDASELPVHLSQIQCELVDTRLINCYRTAGIGNTGCTHSQDIAVICVPFSIVTQVSGECKCLYNFLFENDLSSHYVNSCRAYLWRFEVDG